jgi:hypothetical protein
MNGPTYYCRVCGLTLTPRMEVRGTRYYLSYRCADHPHADQDGREEPRLVEGE